MHHEVVAAMMVILEHQYMTWEWEFSRRNGIKYTGLAKGWDVYSIRGRSLDGGGDKAIEFIISTVLPVHAVAPILLDIRKKMKILDEMEDGEHRSFAVQPVAGEV